MGISSSTKWTRLLIIVELHCYQTLLDETSIQHNKGSVLTLKGGGGYNPTFYSWFHVLARRATYDAKIENLGYVVRCLRFLSNTPYQNFEKILRNVETEYFWKWKIHENAVSPKVFRKLKKWNFVDDQTWRKHQDLFLCTIFREVIIFVAGGQVQKRWIKSPPPLPL